MRLRRVYVPASLALLAFAACTLDPLNPQPLPPGPNTATYEDAGSLGVDGSATKGPEAPPFESDAAAADQSHDAGGMGSGEAGPLPSEDAGVDASSDGGIGDAGADGDAS